MVWYVMVWFGMLWYDLVWFVIVCYCLLFFVIVCYCLLLFVIVCYCLFLFVIVCHCLLLFVIVCYGWYGLVWFGMDCYGKVWLGGGFVFGNVLECSRMFWETLKSFMVVGGGGWYICNYSVYSGPPESEIEIELERTFEASRVDLEIVWT